MVLVTKNYLGSLNHTLLAAEAINRRGLPLLGLVFNGPSDPESENFLLERLKTKKLLSVGHEEELSSSILSKYIKQLQEAFYE